MNTVMKVGRIVLPPVSIRWEYDYIPFIPPQDVSWFSI